MKPEADIPPRARRAAVSSDFADAKASYAAGDGVDHVVVSQWLLTWGKPGRKPFEEWLNEQDG